MEDNWAWEYVKKHDSAVSSMLDAGMSLEEIIVALSREREQTHRQLLKLISLVPKKVISPDGKVYVWHCPDELIPVIGDLLKMGPVIVESVIGEEVKLDEAKEV